MPTPYRRCIYLSETGLQCESYFEALDDNKLCPSHREVNSPSAKNGITDEQKVRYIDLVNDERKYCYHFLDGTSQNQDQELIFQFKDDESGTVFEKLDRHIAFLEKVLEDVKARHQSSRAVRAEKLNNLTEEERKELRKIKIEKATTEKTKSVSFKKDPIANLAKTSKLIDAKSLLDMDPDEMIAKFKKARQEKLSQNDNAS